MCGSKLLLDPSAEEERNSSAVIGVSYLPTLGRIAHVTQVGELEVAQLIDGTKVCADGASQVSVLMRNSLRKRAKKLSG